MATVRARIIAAGFTTLRQFLASAGSGTGQPYPVYYRDNQIELTTPNREIDLLDNHHNINIDDRIHEIELDDSNEVTLNVKDNTIRR